MSRVKKGNNQDTNKKFWVTSYTAKNQSSIDFIPIPFSSNKHMFTIDGLPCYAVRVHSFYTKQMVAYETRKNDFRICCEVLSLLKEKRNSKDSITVISLTTTFLITYGRAFSASKLYGPLIKEKHVPSKFRETHRKAIYLRDNYIAHASGSGEAGFVAAALRPDKNNKEFLFQTPTAYVRTRAFDESFADSCFELCGSMYNYTKEKCGEYYQKSVELIHEQSLSKLYSGFEEQPDLEINYPPAPYRVGYQLNSDSTVVFQAFSQEK